MSSGKSASKVGKQHPGIDRNDVAKINAGFIPKQNKIAKAINDKTTEEKKKTFARQSWNDLEGLFQACGNAIVEVGMGVNQLISSVPNLEKLVENPKEFLLSINGLKSDLDRFTDELAAIHAKHSDKSGAVKDDVELVESLNIFEDYTNFNIRFTALTLPTMTSITEQVGAVVERLRREAPAIIADDGKNVVIDVKQ